MKNWSELIARGRAGAPASKTSNNDTTLFVPRQCFVVMPFEKKHFLKPGAIVDKKEGGVAVHEEQIETIDFDQVYKKLISAAVSKASKNFPQEIECKRSDEVTQSGFIQKDMITRLATADIVIVDITTLNANVFYELGIRHSIRRSATVIIRKRGTTVPFNVTGMRIFDYSLEEDDANRDTDGRTPLQRSIDDLEQVIRHSLSHKENDSLVHNVLPNLNVHQSSYPLIDRHKVSHEVMDADNEAVPGARIGFITGDIMHIHDIDGWINAENTNMQMARIHDGSVSSLIRYFGAKKDWCGRVLDDTIADTLSNVAHRMGVEASTVVVTRPAQLKATNGV